MSEKRFNCVLGKDYHIINDNVDDMTYFLQERNDVVKLVGVLNEQQVTITKLKELNDDKGKRIISLIRTNKTLKEENEQLRQQQQRLYNYFRDYLEDEMSAENFGEMWDNVKEDERWNDE